MGVQQRDPLSPMYFCLVLHKIVSAIVSDENCSSLLFHAWYQDDGVVAGPKHAVSRALTIIQELGPPLGLFNNAAKCKLFSISDLSMFPPEMKRSSVYLIWRSWELLLGMQFFVPKLYLRSVLQPPNYFPNWKSLVLWTPKLLSFCYDIVADFVSLCTWQYLHPLLSLPKDWSTSIMMFVSIYSCRHHKQCLETGTT